MQKGKKTCPRVPRESKEVRQKPRSADPKPHSLFPTLEAPRVPVSFASLRSDGAGSSEEEEEQGEQ